MDGYRRNGSLKEVSEGLETLRKDYLVAARKILERRRREEGWTAQIKFYLVSCIFNIFIIIFVGVTIVSSGNQKQCERNKARTDAHNLNFRVSEIYYFRRPTYNPRQPLWKHIDKKSDQIWRSVMRFVIILF